MKKGTVMECPLFGQFSREKVSGIWTSGRFGYVFVLPPGKNEPTHRRKVNPLNRKSIKAKKPIVIQRTAVATEKNPNLKEIWMITL
jgi:hypothetical protein